MDSEEGSDGNYGDTSFGHGSGNDLILSGEGDETNIGNRGTDVFLCGEGEDTITDYNPDEGDVKAANCENF